MRKALFGILFSSFFLVSCSKTPKQPVSIAINPWPGYEFLYLAEKKGFFDKVDLNAKLIELGSLSDSQRAYVNATADGMASTLIEAVQAQVIGDRPLKVVMVPDFSNGGDVIIAKTPIASMADLKGKTVGCEVTSLGIFFLQRALASADLTLDDVTIKNVEQMRGKEALLDGTIDAFVSYPPTSIKAAKHPDNQIIFTSAAIPNEIIDTISISEDALAANPDLVPKLYEVWQMALDYYQTNQDDAVAIMAKREGIEAEEFIATLGDLKILDSQEQRELFAEAESIQASATEVCRTLVHVDSISFNCDLLPNMIYQK